MELVNFLCILGGCIIFCLGGVALTALMLYLVTHGDHIVARRIDRAVKCAAIRDMQYRTQQKSAKGDNTDEKR